MSLLGNLVNAAQQRIGQAYHAGVKDYQQVYNNVTAQQHPVAPLAPQAQQQIQNAHYGVLANNPQAQQQFIQQQLVPSFFHLPQVAASTFGHAAAALPGQAINAVQVPYSAGRVVAANLTHNQPALTNAHKALASDTANNILWNDAYRQTSNEIAGAIASRNYMQKTTAANDKLGQTIAAAYGNTPRAKIYGQTVAESGKNQDINRYLNNVGIDQNTSKLRTGLQLGAPIVSAGAQTALQAAGAGAGGKIADKALAEATAKLTAEQLAKQQGKQLLTSSLKFGAANAGIGALNPIAQGSTNPMDYAKAIGGGFVSGAAMPLAGAALSKGSLPIVKAGGRVANDAVQAAAAKRSTVANYDATISGLQKQKADLQQRIQGTTNFRGVETTQQHIDQIDSQIAHVQANKPKLTVKDKVLAPNVGLTVGGPNASKYYLAKKAGKVFDGVDGKPRFEIDDSKAKIVNPDGKTLGEMLHHPELYKNYPDLKNVKVGYDEYLDPTSASYLKNRIDLGDNAANPKTILHETQHAIQDREKFASGGDVPEHVDPKDVIKKTPDYPKWQQRLKQLNELKLQRDGQGPEGMQRSDRAAMEQEIYNLQRNMRKAEHSVAMDTYERFAGEAEARTVGNRVDLPMSERYKTTEPSYKDLAAQGIHKQPGLTDKQLESLSPQAIDGLKQQGYKGVSNGKRTVRFDEPSHKTASQYVKAQGRPLFHGSESADAIRKDGFKDMSGTNMTPAFGKGNYFYTKKGDAKGYGDVVEAYLPPNAKLYKASDSQAYSLNTDELIKQGYDGVEVPTSGIVVAFDPKKLKLREQLEAEFKKKSQPATSLRSTFYDSLDVPKDQLIIKHDGGTAMSTATLTLRKQMKALAQQAAKETNPAKKDALYQQIDKMIGTIGNADFEEALRRSGPMMSIDKPTASQSTPKLAQSQSAVKPQLPASRGTGGVSSTQLKRSQLTGKALSTPSKDLTAEQYAQTFGVSKAQAEHEMSQVNDKPATKPVPKPQPKAPIATSPNPLEGQVHVPTVDAGNYGLAQRVPGIAANPVQFAGGQTINAVRQLSKADRLNFPHYVEHPEDIAKAENPQAMAEAVKRHQYGTDLVHATSHQVGGKEAHIANYYNHNVDLSSEADRNKYMELATNQGKTARNFTDFNGINHMPRVFQNLEQLHGAGFKVKDEGNTLKQLQDYYSGASYRLHQQALTKAATEADMHIPVKDDQLDLGNGEGVKLSKEGVKQFKGFQVNRGGNLATKVYDKTNKGAKEGLLSLSQYHTVNVGGLQAVPTMIAQGRLPSAAKAAAGMVGSVSRKVSDRILQKAMTDRIPVIHADGTKGTMSTVEAAAHMGTPIKAGNDFTVGGKNPISRSSHLVFDRQIPAAHVQAVRIAADKLYKAGKSIDSAEAHSLGDATHNNMGFVNMEARNLEPRFQKALGRTFIAPQFERSKMAQVKKAFSPSLDMGANMARTSLAAKYAAEAGLAIGGGALLKQGSDSIRDSLIKSALNPGISSNQQDSKGNNIRYKLPSSPVSEIAGTFLNAQRGTDGRMHVKLNTPAQIGQSLQDQGRNKLAIIPSTALKLKTNTDYSSKPLYDPNAPAGVKAQQAATTLGQGLLPIGTQGVVYNSQLDKHLPQGVQQILNANKPGSNAVAKTALSTIGLTPQTDHTTGKGLQNTQYFAASDAAQAPLTPNQKALYNSIHPQSKNPVTGTFQTTPSIYDGQQKATTYLKGPDGAAVLAADNKLNKTLQSQGQAIDPFYNLTPDQQNIALNYSARAQGDTERSRYLQAYPFLTQLSNDRNSFFSSLPPSGATDTAGNSKAQLPANLQYPTQTTAEKALTDKYYNTVSPTTKKQLLQDPAMAAAVAKVKDYSANINAVRRVPVASQIPNSTPPVPKNPNSKSTGGGSKTTYDPTTNTWTRVATKSGKTTVIRADGSQTVTNQGTKSSAKAKSLGLGTKGGFKAYKSNLGSTIKAAKGSTVNPSKYKVAKVSLSGKIKGTAMSKYKQPNLRKKFA